MKILAFTIIYFVLLFDTTKQSNVRQAIMTAKTIGNTIKSPVVKTIGSTIKSSVKMFRQNKSTIKNLGCGLQEKYLRIRNNFGSKSVKYLGEEGIKKFKYMAHYAIGGSKQLVRAKGKKSIQMRSGEQMGRKELGSLINIVSKSKPQLPILSITGSLSKLTQFSFLPLDDTVYFNDHKGVEKISQYIAPIKKDYTEENKARQIKKNKSLAVHNKAYQFKNKDDIAEKKIQYYCRNKYNIAEIQRKYKLASKDNIAEKRKEYYAKHKARISERQRIYKDNNRDDIVIKRKAYYDKNKHIIAQKLKIYNVENKDKVCKKKQEYYVNNRDKILEKKREYYENNKERIVEQTKAYLEKNKDIIKEKRHESYQLNKDKILEQKKGYYQDNKEKINERSKIYYQINKEKVNTYMKLYARRSRANKAAKIEKKKIKFESFLMAENKASENSG